MADGKGLLDDLVNASASGDQSVMACHSVLARTAVLPHGNCGGSMPWVAILRIIAMEHSGLNDKLLVPGTL